MDICDTIFAYKICKQNFFKILKQKIWLKCILKLSIKKEMPPKMDEFLSQCHPMKFLGKSGYIIHLIPREFHGFGKQ